MHKTRITLRAAALLVALSSPVAHAAARPSAARVEAYLSRVAEQLPSPARAALEDIEGAPRRLLAARSYLRADDGLHTRWSWSQEEMEAYTRTREYRALLAEIDRVRSAFERQNPGYTLFANTQARSVDVQLSRWNENAGVARTAARLHRACIEELRADDYLRLPNERAVARFAAFLKAWRPPEAAPLAAPGLSRHGQARAIDFQIMKDGRVVAGAQIASVRSVWEAQGWSRKLRAAVGDANFVGPLTTPNEPWHYEYSPQIRRAAARGATSASAGHGR